MTKEELKAKISEVRGGEFMHGEEEHLDALLDRLSLGHLGINGRKLSLNDDNIEKEFTDMFSILETDRATLPGLWEI